ncbi:hypothetical protein [Rhodococcus artemisiae]|uniref:Uncharacterized protein n=1 Tax=Rhodococcus artemisiae TaxID=714159 RepID=A0ABU7LCH0_9NOCA|nr:hypothetical protein [Rhodococcus artemisiae]MEE2059215.1 hypothetical protein [Rhodococcus artemisiae]
MVTRSLDPSISEDERTALYAEASAIAGEQAYDVFICGMPTMVAYKDKVVGIEDSGQADFVGIIDTRYWGTTS